MDKNITEDELLNLLVQKDSSLTNEDLLDIVLSGKKYENSEIPMLAASNAKWQNGYSKYSTKGLFDLYSKIEDKWSFAEAMVKTGNLSQDEMIFLVMDNEDFAPQVTEAVAVALRNKLLAIQPMSEMRLAKELFPVADKITSDYEIKVFGEFKGRSHDASTFLHKAIAGVIKMKDLSEYEMLEIITTSNYSVNILCRTVKNFSTDTMMAILFLGKLNYAHNHALQVMIGSGKLSRDQVAIVLDRCGHHWPVAISAVKTKLFSIDEMIEIWGKANRDQGVAREIAKTGLATDDHKKQLAGSNSGLLRDLMEVK